jgi:hypothetical protein
MIQHLIAHAEIINFCKNIKQYELNKNAKVCGVDYSNANTAFKLYVELIQVPSRQCIENFLPDVLIEDFLHYCTSWDSTRKSGLAFGIKIDNCYNTRIYYHVKFNKTYSFKEVSRQLNFLTLLGIKLNDVEKGISVEYDSKNVLMVKHYFYIKNKTHIAKILAYKKWSNVDLSNIEELEIYATPTKHKINIIHIDEDYKIKCNIWEMIPVRYQEQVKQDSITLSSEPAYVGRTSDDVLSIYYSLTNKQDNILDI